MQKVWEELNNFEAEAEKIQAEAKEKSKTIIVQAQKDAERLIANSHTYEEEELKKSHAIVVGEANQIREEKLAENRETSARFKANAEKNMNKAVEAILNAVLEDI